MGTLKFLENLFQDLVIGIQNTGLPVECDPVRGYSRQYFSILYFKDSPPISPKDRNSHAAGAVYIALFKGPILLLQHLKGYNAP
jgi:hypothetical protein